MSILMLLKIFSDCCIGFAILGSGPVVFGIPLLLPALLCGVSTAIATFFNGKNWAFPRILCGFLPFGCLFLADGTLQTVLLAVPAVYTAAVIFRGKLELEYYSYREFFIRSLILLMGVYLVLNIVIFLSLASGDGAPALDTEVILRYGFVHMLCGIVLQRQLRMGVAAGKKTNRRQMASLLGVAAAIVVSFLVAEPFLRQQLLSVVGILLTLFALPIMAVINLISAFIQWISQFREVSVGDPVEGTATVPSFTLDTRPIPGMTEVPAEDKPPAAPTDPVLIWGLIVAVFLLIAGVLLYRSFQKRRAYIEVGRIQLSKVDPPKKKRESKLSNRHKVRQAYREFLRMEDGWGLKLKKNDTSADVLRRIRKDTDRESAEKLRQVYLKARYDDRQSITREQVAAAKQALKGTRNKK